MNNDPVRFIFDTNAFSYVADHGQYEAIIVKLNKQNKQLIAFLSIFNLFEYIRGINTDSELARRKKYLRRIKEITLGGAIFPDPITHLQLASGQITRRIGSEKSKALLGVINNFVTVKNTQILRKTFHSLLDNVDSFIKRINEDSAKVQELIRERLEKSTNKRTFKTRLSNPPINSDYDTIIPQLLNIRYSLNIEYLSEKRIEIFNKFPSVKYLCDIYWKYFGHISISNAKPRESDIIDLAQTIYLNIADYFVTRDKHLRDLVNKCGNSDLIGRAISPNMFISMLDNKIVLKRAPQSASIVWIPPPW